MVQFVAIYFFKLTLSETSLAHMCSCKRILSEKSIRNSEKCRDLVFSKLRFIFPCLVTNNCCWKMISLRTCNHKPRALLHRSLIVSHSLKNKNRLYLTFRQGRLHKNLVRAQRGKKLYKWANFVMTLAPGVKSGALNENMWLLAALLILSLGQAVLSSLFLIWTKQIIILSVRKWLWW